MSDPENTQAPPPQFDFKSHPDFADFKAKLDGLHQQNEAKDKQIEQLQSKLSQSVPKTQTLKDTQEELAKLQQALSVERRDNAIHSALGDAQFHNPETRELFVNHLKSGLVEGETGWQSKSGASVEEHVQTALNLPSFSHMFKGVGNIGAGLDHQSSGPASTDNSMKGMIDKVKSGQVDASAIKKDTFGPR